MMHRMIRQTLDDCQKILTVVGRMLRDPGSAPLNQFGEALVNQAVIELLLVLEIDIDGALADPCRLGHIIQPNPVKRLLGKESYCSLNNQLPLVFVSKSHNLMN